MCLRTQGKARWRTDRPERGGYSGDRYWKFHAKGFLMNTIIYIVGLIVVVGFILSFFGLR